MPRLPWPAADLDHLGEDFLTRSTDAIRSALAPYMPQQQQQAPSHDYAEPAPTAVPAPSFALPSFDLSEWSPWREKPAAPATTETVTAAPTATAAAPAAEAPAPRSGLSFDLSDWAPWRGRPKPAPALPPTSAATTPRSASGTPVAFPEQASAATTAGAANEPLGPIAEGDPQSYFATAGPYARQVERETGGRVPAALSLAISANETGYGQTRYMAGPNNYHGIQDTTGTGTPYVDWRINPETGQKESYAARQAGFASPLEGFRGFARFLMDNPRYKPALDRYQQTGDVNQLAADIHAAGYAEDPAYTQKITSIMRGIPVPTGVGEVTAAPGVRPGTPLPAEQTPAAQAQAPTSLTGITPPQFGLGDADAEAICGPVLAMAFARSTGRNPTIAEAKQLAAQYGGWTSAQGMGGPEKMAATLRAMGVPATYKPGALDLNQIRRETQNGNPVGINTSGHYFVVEGVDDQGRLDLGNSAKALRASGGRQWFRPDEIAGLGMGAPTGAIYKDSPSSPTPSVAVKETGLPPVSLKAGAEDMPIDTEVSPGEQKRAKMSQAASGQPVPMPGNVDAQSTGGIETVPSDSGASYADPYGLMQYPVDVRNPVDQPYDATTREGVDATNEPMIRPPGPSGAMPRYQPGAQMQRAPLMASTSNGAYVPSDFAPGDSGTAPQTYEQPYNPDEGPHEATPGSVGAQPVTNPVENIPENIPGPDQTDQGTPITYQPRSYGTSLSEAGPEQPPSPPAGPFKPLYDAAGQIVGYVQGAADQAYQALEPARRAAADLSGPPGYGQVQSPGPGEPDYVSQGGSVIRALTTPIRPPERQPGPTQAELDAMTPDQRTTALARAGSMQDVAAIPFQAAEAARQTVVNAAETFANAIRAGQEGRPLAAAANALWGALQATPPMAGYSVASSMLDQMLPEANILGVGPGVMVGMQDLIRLGFSGVNGLKNAAGALTPDRLAAAYEAPGRAVGAVQRGAAAAGRFIQEGREPARALNAAPETGMYSTFGPAPRGGPDEQRLFSEFGPRIQEAPDVVRGEESIRRARIARGEEPSPPDTQVPPNFDQQPLVRDTAERSANDINLNATLGAAGRTLNTEALNAAAGALAANVVSGDVIPDPNDQRSPQERLQDALIHGGVGAALAILTRHGVRAVGGRQGLERALQGEGPLATFGQSPSYRPPTPQQIAAAEARGAARGARLNQEVTAPVSEVPKPVQLATSATDDRAGLRWAEDVLTDAAGSPRLGPNDVARPSTQSRVNAGSIADTRIQTTLEPPVIEAGRAGLQNELPQYLEDMHQRDILDEFYRRGHQEAVDKAQPGLERMRAKGASAEAIQQAEARIEQAADAAGVKKMRTRQGSNPDMTYEAIDARLQAQEQRVKAAGKWQQLQDSAQGIWDHNAETRQRALDAGEISQEMSDAMERAYPHYVPTVPLSHLDPGGVGPTASTSARVSRGNERVVRALDDVGTSGERLNPIVASRAATIRVERAAQRNEVFTSFAHMFEDAMNAAPGTLTTPGGPRHLWNGDTDVSGFINGEPATIRVPKPVADGLAAAGGMGVSGNAFTDAWRRVTQAVAQTLTSARISFLPVNLVRDFQDYAAMTAAKSGGAPALPGVLGTWFDELGKAALDVARAYAVPRTAAGAAIGAAGAAAQGDENTTLGERLRHAVEGGVAGAVFLGAPRGVKVTGNAAEYLARGGGMGSIDAGWRASQRWYRDVLRDGGAVVKTPADAARYLGDWLADVASLQGVRGLNERAELISRTAAMRRAEAAGAPATEAMIAGRNASVDFDRAGTVTRAINGFIPFTNASVQGSAQMVRMIRQNPAGAATTIATTVGIPMAALEWWNRSDPQRAEVYNDIPDYAKNTGMVAVMPWAGRDNRGDRPNWLYIPTGNLTPFVVGMRAAMANIPGLEPVATRQTDPGLTQRAVNGLGAVLEMFSPVRGDTLGAAASSMIPPVAKQAVELSQNRDLFRGSAIVTDQADERASSASKNVAGALNAIGQQTGNDWLQNVRPSAIEYLIRQPAAYGDLITGTSDLVSPSGYRQSEDRPVQNEPVSGGMVGRFVRDTGGANLDRARADMLTESVRGVLQDAGMRPADLKPVPSQYKRAPLTRDEQLRWQQTANAYLGEELAKARDSAGWDDPSKRQELVQKAVSRAQAQAAQESFTLTDADIRDRIEADQARKAS